MVSGGGGPVVSLTSHGARLTRVHVSIESIAQGTALPSRVILWLDDADVVNDLPKKLRRQVRRGLEVRLSKNYGPHTKYFPYVRSQETHEFPLVTADDDVVYPKWWLEGLLKARETHSTDVIAYRARRIRFQDGVLQPYETWPFSTDQRASVLNFGTGHSGVYYPTSMLNALAELDERFVDKCLKADDVWLHWAAFRSGHAVRLVRSESTAFQTVGGTQKSALKHSNVTARANDPQIAATYSAADLLALSEAAGEERYGG